jgi:hypothetical protein
MWHYIGARYFDDAKIMIQSAGGAQHLREVPDADLPRTVPYITSMAAGIRNSSSHGQVCLAHYASKSR